MRPPQNSGVRHLLATKSHIKPIKPRPKNKGMAMPTIIKTE